MKTLIMLSGFLVATSATAGIVHGSLTLRGERVVDREIKITCRSQNEYVGKTDEHGAYTINVKEQGRCSLSLVHMEQTLTHPVSVYADPVRYDFAIIRTPDRRWDLKRR